MRPFYDALIIGAGPAGSTLARQLARGGWRTALVDREPLGRDRVCGGFLGPEAARLWREQFAGRARLGRWLGWCERRPAVSEGLLRWLSRHPAIFGRMARYVRPAMRGRALAMAGQARNHKGACPWTR